MRKRKTPMATNVYMPQDKLLRIIDNNKENRMSLRKWKKKETKKSLYKPTRNSPFNFKREKNKKSRYKPGREILFKSKI